MAFRAGEKRPDGTRRVVITGAGIITPMGNGWDANGAGFRAGRVALRPVSHFDVSGQRAGIAGEIDLPAKPPIGKLRGSEATRIDRATAMLLHAANQALAGAGWLPGEDGERTPLVLGTSAGAMQLGEAFYRTAVAGGSRRGQAVRVDGYQAQRQAMKVAEACGIGGATTIVSNACASGANAIGHAFDLIAKGRAERVLAGGYDALCQLLFAGFDSLQALSVTTPRPFAADRDGLALGEGAALCCLETLGSARKRGAGVFAEVVGYGAATDTHHLTQPNPQGDAALRTMRKACEMARITAADVGYVNSHGTGTPLNDSSEANAIARWAGSAAQGLPVSSTKGGIGHLLGGAGAVEAVISLLALDGGWLPPNVAVEKLDPACTFDLVTQARDQAELRTALSNSFGFGGANATLVFSKLDG